MESPISRTSSSHSIYAPGPHRRSHPNLQHLSLAPLTPRYPIDPADYLAYHDPTTANLHTSASISHIASLPSPSGILTNSPARSRNTSRSRLLKRKVKSHVNVVAPTEAAGAQLPSGAVSSAGYGYSRLRPLQPQQQGREAAARSKSHTHLSSALMPDASWLVQTGLALTESSRENKGQSWLGKRDSSTSLVGLVTAPVSPVEERGREYGLMGGFGSSPGGLTPGPYPYFCSGRATPSRSRGNSRHGSRSRKGSRRYLAMTGTTTSALTSPTSPTDDRSRTQQQQQQQAQQPQRTPSSQPPEDDEIQPDWADSASRLEFSSQHQPLQPRYSSEYFSEPAIDEEGEEAEEDDLVERFYDLPDELLEEDDDMNDDPYGQLNLDAHFDNGSDIVDEDEVRRELKRRNGGVLGRWFDGVVDVFLMLEEEDEGDHEGDVDDGGQRRRGMEIVQALVDGAADAEPTTQDGEKGSAWEVEQQEADQEVEPPPEQPQGVWDDVKWLGRLMARSIGS